MPVLLSCRSPQVRGLFITIAGLMWLNTSAPQSSILYHIEKVRSIVKRKTHCVFCNGTGILLRVSEFPFFENHLWCSCPIGQGKSQMIAELTYPAKVA